MNLNNNVGSRLGEPIMCSCRDTTDLVYSQTAMSRLNKALYFMYRPDDMFNRIEEELE